MYVCICRFTLPFPLHGGVSKPPNWHRRSQPVINVVRGTVARD
jgi:hypothetical protein